MERQEHRNEDEKGLASPGGLEEAKSRPAFSESHSSESSCNWKSAVLIFVRGEGVKLQGNGPT